jgi:hypothetical protein
MEPGRIELLVQRKMLELVQVLVELDIDIRQRCDRLKSVHHLKSVHRPTTGGDGDDAAVAAAAAVAVGNYSLAQEFQDEH